jgi:hypothetical protein
MSGRFRHKSPKFFFIIPMVLIGIAAFSAIVMLLWNGVLVPILHAGIINFWQALGILVLSKILFGGFRGGHWGRHQWKQQHLQERWESMSPEEREKFRSELKNRCGRRFDAFYDRSKFGPTEEPKSEQQPS